MNTNKGAKFDLRDEIEQHCIQCGKCASSDSLRDRCLFGTLDMTTSDLGGREIYNRVFRMLKVHGIKGYKRSKRFGNYLDIPLEKICTKKRCTT